MLLTGAACTTKEAEAAPGTSTERLDCAKEANMAALVMVGVGQVVPLRKGHRVARFELSKMHLRLHEEETPSSVCAQADRGMPGRPKEQGREGKGGGGRGLDAEARAACLLASMAPPSLLMFQHSKCTSSWLQKLSPTGSLLGSINQPEGLATGMMCLVWLA